MYLDCIATGRLWSSHLFTRKCIYIKVYIIWRVYGYLVSFFIFLPLSLDASEEVEMFWEFFSLLCALRRKENKTEGSWLSAPPYQSVPEAGLSHNNDWYTLQLVFLRSSSASQEEQLKPNNELKTLFFFLQFSNTVYSHYYFSSLCSLLNFCLLSLCSFFRVFLL